MTWKQLETAREARLWVKEVIAPTALVVGLVASNPEIRKSVATKFNNIKSSIENKFKKDKEEEA